MTAGRPLLGLQAPASPGTAIGLILVGVMMFSVSDVAAKQLARSLPSLEITWLRYAILAIVAIAFAARGGRDVVRAAQPWLQIARGLALLGSGAFFLLGLGRLGVAEATAIAFVTPAFITALSIPLLGEVVGWRRWASVGFGLLGVVLVVRPGGRAFEMAALFSLASALCGALAVIATRKLGARTRARTTLLWSAMSGLVLLTASAPFWFETPSWRELGFAAAMGCAYALAQLCMILAYRQAEASLLAPFTYAQLLSSTALAYLAFGVSPDAVGLLGVAVIVASGAYALHREQRVRRLRSREAANPAAIAADHAG